VTDISKLIWLASASVVLLAPNAARAAGPPYPHGLAVVLQFLLPTPFQAVWSGKDEPSSLFLIPPSGPAVLSSSTSTAFFGAATIHFQRNCGIYNAMVSRRVPSRSPGARIVYRLAHPWPIDCPLVLHQLCMQLSQSCHPLWCLLSSIT
jgi:hypothetical protein